jgi:hypothetical protein
MIKALKKHSLYYILLSLVLMSGFFLFLSFSSHPQTQVMIVMLTSFAYVGFALLHHYMNGDLTVKVVVEYVLIAALGISLVFFYLT